MPAQLVHLAYAQNYLAAHADVDQTAFLRGTCFADIRRMAGMEREKTHRSGVTLGEMEAEPDAWRAGLLLHSYLDEKWNQFFVDRGLRVDNDLTERVWSSVKIAEEAAFCGTISGREALADAMDAPAMEQELGYNIDEALLGRWYGFIAWKLRHRFDLEVWRREAAVIGFDLKKLDRLLGRVEPIRADPQWQARFDVLHRELGIGHE